MLKFNSGLSTTLRLGHLDTWTSFERNYLACLDNAQTTPRVAKSLLIVVRHFDPIFDTGAIEAVQTPEVVSAKHGSYMHSYLMELVSPQVIHGLTNLT